MTALHHSLLICDNDKFACIGGLPFFYCCEDVPTQAVKVNTDEAGNSIYAIAHQDIDLSQSPEESTGQIEFLRFRHLIGSLDALQTSQLAKAMQLLRWRQDHQFCSRCVRPRSYTPLKMPPFAPAAIITSIPESSLVSSPLSSKPLQTNRRFCWRIIYGRQIAKCIPCWQVLWKSVRA